MADGLINDPNVKYTQNITEQGTTISPVGGPRGMTMAIPGDGDIAMAVGEVRQGSARMEAEGMSSLTGGPPAVVRRPSTGAR